MNLTCRSCGSKRLLRGIRVVSVGGFRVNVEVPSASGLGKPVRSSVSADVCVDCGQLDLHAVNLTELRRLYASIGEPLGLNSRDPAGFSEETS